MAHFKRGEAACTRLSSICSLTRRRPQRTWRLDLAIEQQLNRKLQDPLCLRQTPLYGVSSCVELQEERAPNAMLVKELGPVACVNGWRIRGWVDMYRRRIFFSAYELAKVRYA